MHFIFIALPLRPCACLDLSSVSQTMSSLFGAGVSRATLPAPQQVLQVMVHYHRDNASSSDWLSLFEMPDGFGDGLDNEEWSRRWPRPDEYVGTCNQTHQVRYYACDRCGKELPPPHLNIYLAFPTDELPVVPVGQNNSVRLLYTEDQSTNILYQGLRGAVGVLGLSKASRIVLPPSIFGEQRITPGNFTLPLQPRTRRTLGIWVDNCAPPTRRRIIRTLLASGMPVRSYGECFPNQHTKWRTVRLDNDDEGMGEAECSGHRVMLAVENEHCPGYIGNMLMNVLKRCRAIPIINTIGGMPDHYTELGYFPAINASQPGWLNLTRRIMTDDVFYARFLEKAHWHKRRHPQHPGWAKLNNGSAHCQYFDARLHELPRRYVRWEPCAYCKGEVEECQEIDRHRVPSRDKHAEPAFECYPEAKQSKKIIDQHSCPLE